MLLRIEHPNILQQNDRVLVAFAFGGHKTDEVERPAVALLGDSPTHEVWYTSDPVRTGHHAALRWRASANLLFGSINVPLDDKPADRTRVLYRQFLDAITELGYPHLLRIWNFVPGINSGEGDRECYKGFSLGRAQALEDSRFATVTLPAATAVGTATNAPLQVYFLATRMPNQHFENPRQMSAFDYPRCYGPRSPQFSRATLFAPPDNDALLLVSGTASIVGHESRHVGSLEGQLRETRDNLERITAEAGVHRPLSFRVYLRHARDYPAARQFMDGYLPGNVPVVYLQADLCRSELLVEIESVYSINDTSAR